jgi:hypothetical protein
VHILAYPVILTEKNQNIVDRHRIVGTSQYITISRFNLFVGKGIGGLLLGSYLICIEGG